MFVEHNPVQAGLSLGGRDKFQIFLSCLLGVVCLC